MVKTYKLFTTPMCPNCPPVKEFVKTLDIEGKLIDASTDEGRQEAMDLGIASVPTFVLFEDDKETSRAHSLDEIKALL